jgi:hypothetical protein
VSVVSADVTTFAHRHRTKDGKHKNMMAPAALSAPTPTSNAQTLNPMALAASALGLFVDESCPSPKNLDLQMDHPFYGARWNVANIKFSWAFFEFLV